MIQMYAILNKYIDSKVKLRLKRGLQSKLTTYILETLRSLTQISIGNCCNTMTRIEAATKIFQKNTDNKL